MRKENTSFHQCGLRWQGLTKASNAWHWWLFVRVRHGDDTEAVILVVGENPLCGTASVGWVRC